MSTSESSSSLDRRADDGSVLFDKTGVDDDDEGGDVISTECCRRTGRSGKKAVGEWLEVTSKLLLVLGDDGDGVE